jgi:hypothetical protein
MIWLAGFLAFVVLFALRYAWLARLLLGWYFSSDKILSFVNRFDGFNLMGIELLNPFFI